MHSHAASHGCSGRRFGSFGVNGVPTLHFQHALGALGPITAAFLVSASECGRAGPSDLLRRMVQWRRRLGWVAVGLIAPFVLLALALVGASLLGGESLSWSHFGRSGEFPRFSALGFFAYNIVSFGYGEEVGWRGFALPRLQARHSALVSSLLLTCGWALWHAPLFLYRPGYTQMNGAGIAGWFFSLVTGAVMLTWLYNGSRGSILVVALFHAAVDVSVHVGSVVAVCGQRRWSGHYGLGDDRSRRGGPRFFVETRQSDQAV